MIFPRKGVTVVDVDNLNVPFESVRKFATVSTKFVADTSRVFELEDPMFNVIFPKRVVPPPSIF